MPTALQGISWFPTKGLFLNSPANACPNDMASSGYDFVINNGIELAKRDGYAAVNTLPISASASVLGLYSLYLSNGTNYELILGNNGVVYIDNSGDVTASAVGGVYVSDPVDYTQFLDTGIWVNGSSNPITWNGTVSANISAAPSAGISCENHLNKLFIAIKNTSMFKYSATGDYHTWTGVGTDTVNVDQNNGQNIVAVKTFARNELIIFKDNSMYKFVGETASNFTLIKIDSSIGCSCVKSIKTYRSTTGGGLMLWAYRDGIYCYDGTVPRKITTYIQTFWDTVNKTRLKWCDSTIDNDTGRYIISVPIGATVNNTRCIVIDLSLQWLDDNGLHMPIFLWRLSSQAFNTEINQTTNAQRVVFGSTGGYKYYMSNLIYSDNGSGITMEIASPMFPFEGSLGIENCLRRLYGIYKTTGGTLNIYYNTVDSEDYIFANSIDLTSAGGADAIGIDFEIGVSQIGETSGTDFVRTNLSARGPRIKVKLSNTASLTGFNIYSPIELYFKGGGMRA